MQPFILAADFGQLRVVSQCRFKSPVWCYVKNYMTTEDGKTLHRSEQTATTNIRSIFGLHLFEQFTYAPRAKKAIEQRPISARMFLPK